MQYTGDAMSDQPPELAEAIRLYREGRRHESREKLVTLLTQQPAYLRALVGLARGSDDLLEAQAAAELATRLAPHSEDAKRALAEVLGKIGAETAAEILRATGMTLAQARRTTWVGRGARRPIGELLDGGLIKGSDLAWAVDSSYDPRCQGAARAILLHRLLGVEPAEKPRIMPVVQVSDYTERQERISLLIFSLLLGVILTLYISVVIWLIGAIVPGGWGRSAWSLLAFWIIMPFFIPGLMAVVRRYQIRSENYRQGREGEDRAVEELRYSLDGQWTLYRNLEWPHRRWGDIDLVLAGPGGLWAFEVKAYQRPLRVRGEQWQYRGRWFWRRLSRDPGRQARRNAANLKSYLEMHGVRVGWVQAGVIWAGEAEKLILQDPAMPVWTVETLAAGLEQCAGRPLTAEQLQQVNEVLGQVVEEWKKADAARK
jgi:hypothetical protein